MLLDHESEGLRWEGSLVVETEVASTIALKEHYEITLLDGMQDSVRSQGQVFVSVL